MGWGVMRSGPKLPALPQANYVTLGKLLTLSEVQHPHLPVKEAKALVFASSNPSN